MQWQTACRHSGGLPTSCYCTVFGAPALAPGIEQTCKVHAELNATLAPVYYCKYVDADSLRLLSCARVTLNVLTAAPAASSCRAGSYAELENGKPCGLWVAGEAAWDETRSDSDLSDAASTVAPCLEHES